MSRRPFVAGNWKMNLRDTSARQLAAAVRDGLGSDHCEVAVCPPSVYLGAVAETLRGSSVGVGGQNMWPREDGAFTGEINAAMLVDLGCKYVILGHSERRQFCGETDSVVAEKCGAAFAGGLIPIVCVGETLEERDQDRTEQVVTTQVEGSLQGVSLENAPHLVIAYEPVWAIGTGRTATPEQAEAVHAVIRQVLGRLFSPEIADQIRIQYGGSVKPNNALELLGQPNIDGALVGGASLKAEDFLAIIQAAPKS